MKKLLTLSLALVVAINIWAQQEIQSTHFVINPFLLNPAYSSMDDNYDFKIGHRSQWMGIEGAPTTSYFSFDTPIGKPHWGRTHPGDWHNWHGTGFAILRDKIGPYTNTRVNANYSFNLKLIEGKQYGYEHKDGLRMSFGAHMGWNSFQVNKDLLGMSKLANGSAVDHASTLSDPTYNALQTSASNIIDITFGTLIYYNDHFFVGASTTQLLEQDIALTEGHSLSRHYFLTGTIKQRISEEWYVLPAGIVKIVAGAPISYNVSARLDWQDRFFGGLGYRSNDAVTFMAGLRYKWGEKIKNFRVDKHRYILQLYYSYDMTVNRLGHRELQERSGGSHEITLGFLIPPMFKERNAEDTW